MYCLFYGFGGLSIYPALRQEAPKTWTDCSLGGQYDVCPLDPKHTLRCSQQKTMSLNT